MNQRIYLYLSVLGVLLILGCGTKVMVPPEIELKEYETVGLIEFTSGAKGALGNIVTQKFLEEISASQKGLRIIELGNMDKVLESVQQDEINPDTIRAIGKKHNLNSIIIGALLVSDVKPSISLASIVTHMSVRAKVEASLTVKLLDTEDGATIWTASAQDKRDVAHVSIFPGGAFHFDADDPEEAYGELVKSLVEEVTVDLRISHKRM